MLHKKPLHWEAHSAQLEKAHVQQWRCSATKAKLIHFKTEKPIANFLLMVNYNDILCVSSFCFFFATWHRGSYRTSPTKDQTRPPVLEVQSLNHWTTKEVPIHFIFKSTFHAEKCHQMLLTHEHRAWRLFFPSFVPRGKWVHNQFLDCITLEKIFPELQISIFVP